MHLATLTLVSLVALAGCKAGSDAAPKSSEAWPSFDASEKPKAIAANPLPKACELVNAEQASTLLAVEAGLMADDPENCMWSGSSGAGILTMLMVQLTDNDDVAMAQTVFNSLAGMQGNLSGMVNSQTGDKTRKSGREIEGLGDEAWLSSASYGESFGKHGVGGQMLTVRKGSRLLTLNVTGTSKVEGLGARMESLARRVVDRL